MKNEIIVEELPKIGLDDLVHRIDVAARQMEMNIDSLVVFEKGDTIYREIVDGMMRDIDQLRLRVRKLNERLEHTRAG